MGAEKLLAAERDGQKIAVEIKSFINTSNITDFHLAIEQFINYRVALKVADPERKLFLAVPDIVYNTFFQKEFAYKPSYGDIEIQTVFDSERDHYQVVAIGWNHKERVYGCSIHLDIKDEKIWIQVNNTELDIAQNLVEKGISKEDIVIGFQPPYLRQYSGYASV